MSIKKKFPVRHSWVHAPSQCLRGRRKRNRSSDPAWFIWDPLTLSLKTLIISQSHFRKLNVFVVVFICLLFVFQGCISLCSPGYPRTLFEDQADLKSGDRPASAFQVLGLKAWATTVLPKIEHVDHETSRSHLRSGYIAYTGLGSWPPVSTPESWDSRRVLSHLT